MTAAVIRRVTIRTYDIRRTVIDILSSACVSRGLDTLRKKGKSSIPDLPIDSVSLSLQDLIGYFQPPGDHLEHEDKQNRLRALKNRQNLFQEEVRSVCVRMWGLGLVYITTHNYEVGFPIQNLLINFLGQNIAINALCKLELI